MKGPLFYAKILLFGEYGIIKDSKGLTIPYNSYQGALKKSELLSEEIKKSNKNLLNFYAYLTNLESKESIDLRLNELKTDIDTAEAIKVGIGSCLFKGGNKKEKIEIEGEEPLVFPQKMLTRIIEARVSEIFGEVQKELKQIYKDVDIK